MDSSLTENQEMLLFKACKDKNGVVTMRLAKKIYSSNGSAETAVKKLELFEYTKRTAPGCWKVVKLPNDIKRELKALQEDKQEEQKAPEKREDSSEFEIKA